jgi:hypothetical protein
MLLQLLRNDPTISLFIGTNCSENGISADLDLSILAENIVIIKVDRFYNTVVQDPAPSPDCLVILQCSENRYRIFIIELKDISNAQGFTVDNVTSKFITCLDDFMSSRYGNYFHNAQFTFDEIKLLFITDPYHFKVDPAKQLRMRGHKLDALIAQRIPKFFDRHLYIEYKVPNPTIRNCQ